MNLLYNKKRYFDDGGVMSNNTLKLTGDLPTQLAGYQPAKATMPKQNNFLQNAGNNIAGYAQVAQAGIQGAMNGINNTDKGKHDTVMGTMNQQMNDANNVSQSYTAGQDVNTLSKTGAANTANGLKTHKGWVNILGSTVTGALAGAKVGGVWGAAIGGAIGLVGSSIGEIFGRRKRKKQEEEERQKKMQADYAIDYYNDKQFEQLASANDQAAKVTADQNRTSTLALMAYGGRKNNYLISNKRTLLC